MEPNKLRQLWAATGHAFQELTAAVLADGNLIGTSMAS